MNSRSASSPVADDGGQKPELSTSDSKSSQSRSICKAVLPIGVERTSGWRVVSEFRKADGWSCVLRESGWTLQKAGHVGAPQGAAFVQVMTLYI